MKHYSIIILALLCFCIKNIQAQNVLFLSQGRIEFERKVSLWAEIDDGDYDAGKEAMKKAWPQFKSNYFNLVFNNTKTLYSPGQDNTDNNNLWQQPAEDNTVYTNLQDSLSISQKNVFEQSFLVNDSTRKIKWKITNETRTIAGFNCRRANAIMMDSVYIVAFYTDEITTTGGPESFNGLPGMILGVAIPHEHITWFATKVYADKITDKNLIAPAKGKKMTPQELLKTLQPALKDWGGWGKTFIRQIMY